MQLVVYSQHSSVRMSLMVQQQHVSNAMIMPRHLSYLEPATLFILPIAHISVQEMLRHVVTSGRFNVASAAADKTATAMQTLEQQHRQALSPLHSVCRACAQQQHQQSSGSMCG